MMKSGWKLSTWSPQAVRNNREKRENTGRVFLPLWAILLGLTALPSSAQKGVPMTPDRLDSLTQGRTLELRVRASSLTQVLPSVTQQMLYRVRLTPEAPDLSFSIFCSGAKLSQLEHAITTLYGYKLLGRSQGEGMGLVFVPDPQAMAAAARHRLQGRKAVEAGIERALAWIKEPQQLPAIARSSCPAAGTLSDVSVRRAFALHAALTPDQHAAVMLGHPVVLPYTALPASSRRLLPAGKSTPRWLAYYLYANPWNPGDALRLAVRVEPSGPTWLSCPPLDLVPAHYPESATPDAAFKSRLTGEPELEDLDAGEEAPAIFEWMADKGNVWIIAEALRPYQGGVEQLKKLAAGCQGLPLEEALDRAAAEFGATWHYDQGWVLIQRRSVGG
jgi:hypothetical protein